MAEEPSEDEITEEEVQKEEQIHEQISQLEEKFGGLVEEHKQVLSEEKDIVRKLEIADEMVKHSENLERKFLDRSHSGDVGTELQAEMGEVVAILKAVSSEIADLKSKIEEEEQQAGSLDTYEKQIFERSQELMRTHSAVTGDEIPFNIEEYEQKFENMSADQLRQHVDDNFF